MNIVMSSNAIHRIGLLALLMLTLTMSTQVLAEKLLPDIDEKHVSVIEQNPVRDVGYVVGDVLSRTVSVTINKPYELVKESLPIVGYEHRWKGKKSGIELVKINTREKQHADSTTYTMELSYQVFTTGRVAKPAALRGEVLKIRNTENGKVYQYRIPSFGFRVSPMSVFGQVNLEEEMSPFMPPLTLHTDKEVTIIKWLAAILGLSLLGLLYIFGKYAWLPKMGAPFAKAYREISKAPDTASGLQQAVSSVHQSLNKTFGGSLFNHHIDAFIQDKPRFAPMKDELEKFFKLSGHVFFALNANNDESEAEAANAKQWLATFCRRMRDCERGLVPDLPAGEAS